MTNTKDLPRLVLAVDRKIINGKPARIDPEFWLEDRVYATLKIHRTHGWAQVYGFSTVADYPTCTFPANYLPDVMEDWKRTFGARGWKFEAYVWVGGKNGYVGGAYDPSPKAKRKK